MRYLIRVDDYPRGLYENDKVSPDKHRDFHKVFNDFDIPYCLGVVPAIITPEQINYLKTLENITIAQHGWDHSVDFLQLPPDIIKKRLLKGREILKDFSPDIYITPFNEIGSMEIFAILEDCGFKIVTGGPESERVLPDIWTIRKIGKILYVPTHQNFYGTSWNILNTYKGAECSDLVCITLHWTWEVNFLYNGSLIRLLSEIKPFITDWRNMDTKYITIEEYPMKISSRIPFKLITDRILPNSRVLDMGSKDSALPAFIARKGCDVTALDLSDKDLREGLRHASKLGVQYRAVCEDFFDYEPNVLFDYITGCYSFGENPKYLGKDYSRNTSEIKSQFEKANQLLKIYGKLLIAVPFTKEETAWVNEQRGDPMYIFNVDSIVTLIADSGFKIIALHYYTYNEQQGTTELTNRDNAIAMFVEAEKI